MNAYLRKEIRLLLPCFGIAMVMALSVWLIPAGSDQEPGRWVWLIMIPVVLCPALVVMTALDSFGREIGSHTFANLLAQPVSRSRIWRTKTSLLAVALLAVFVVWWTSFALHLPKIFWANSKDMHETLVVTVMILVTVYSGGLWTVLLLRQVGAAFWFTLIIPSAVAMLTVYVAGKLGLESYAEGCVVFALLVYSSAGFFWARRLFLRAQDVHWTGGEIILPAWVKLPRIFVPAVTFAGRRPRLALLIKEFQLHQSQFVIAGILALAHLLLIALRNTHGELKASWGFEFVAFNFWTLWLVMPLLIGCTAVAEERKLGTLEAQLCLPVRRRTQFILKAIVALVLAMFFGVAVPVLLEAGRILPDFTGTLEGWRNLPSFVPAYRGFVQVAIEFLTACLPVLSVLFLVLLASLIAAIAFYASTLARNTLQAIAPAIMGVLILWGLLLGAANIEAIVNYPVWHGLLVYLIGVPVLTITLAWLTFWNFKRMLVGWPVWRRNLIVIFTVLAFVAAATTALYQRGWELCVKLEPEHGPARILGTEAVQLKGQGIRLTAEFADGKAWSARLFPNNVSLPQALLGGWNIQVLPGSQFLPGTNWSTVVHCARDVMALDRDGALWVSAKPENVRQLVQQTSPRQETTQLVRYGNDSDWKSLVNRWSSVFALKQDGTLWRIGPRQFSGKNDWPGLRSFTPERLGDEADWTELSHLSDRVLFRKTDGRAYVQPPNTTTPTDTLTIEEGVVLERSIAAEQTRWRELAWTSVRGRGSFQVGLDAGGTFRVAAKYQNSGVKIRLLSLNTPLGSETNWVGLAISESYSGIGIVTLKSDGTLWAWDFPEDPVTEPTSPQINQLGRHADWIAITSGAGGVVSLAADGSLWLWNFPQQFGPRSIPALLRPSRKPQLLGNIW